MERRPGFFLLRPRAPLSGKPTMQLTVSNSLNLLFKTGSAISKGPIAILRSIIKFDLLSQNTGHTLQSACLWKARKSSREGPAWSGHTGRKTTNKNKQEKLKEKQIVNSHVFRSRVMLVDKHRQKNGSQKNMRAKISKKKKTRKIKVFSCTFSYFH